MAQIKLVTAQISQPSTAPNQPPARVDSFAVQLSAIQGLGFVVIWMMAVLAIVRRGKTSPRHQDQVSDRNIPCRNCQFFHPNYYLKCAVNPTIVMTQSAIECSDYCPSQKALARIERLSSRNPD